MNYPSSCVEDTMSIGAMLARKCAPGDFIALRGDLGAGKTALVRGFGRELGIDDVSSPTFTIVREYEGALPVLHFDCYRLTGEEDLWDIGFDDYLGRAAVILMEWPQVVEGALPKKRIEVTIAVLSEEERQITVEYLFNNQGACE